MKKHFTLVELLIVTGCLGVLASMTLPAAKRAREVALQTQCAANLRQCVQAQISYSQAYDGWCALNLDGYYPWWKVPGMPQELGLDQSSDINLPENRKKTICPAVTVNPNAWSTNQCYGVPRFWGAGSTDFNEPAGMEVEVIAGEWLMLRRNLLPDASKYVILADSAYGPLFSPGNAFQQSGDPCAVFCRRDTNFSGIAKWHLDNADTAYADGHVADTSDRARMWSDSKIGGLLASDGKTVENLSR